MGSHEGCKKEQVWVYDWTNNYDTVNADNKSEKRPLHLEIRDNWRDIGKDKRRLKKIQSVSGDNQTNNSFDGFHKKIFPRGDRFTLSPCSKSDKDKNCMMFADNVCRVLGVKKFASK